MNCAATERQESNGPVYVDYMDGMESIVFNEGTDLSVENFIKWRICPFGEHVASAELVNSAAGLRVSLYFHGSKRYNSG